MKKMNFLAKIKKEGELEIVEPSEEIKQSYLQKSESFLISTKILFEKDKLEESVSLAYYSMYYTLLALLFKVGIKCENHTASIIILNKLFGLSNKIISKAKEERIDKQYYVDFEITKSELQELIEKTELFNNEIYEFISRLNNEKIKEYRSTLKENFF